MPKRVQNFSNHPKGIIMRNDFMSKQMKNVECKAVIDLLKMAIVSPNAPESAIIPKAISLLSNTNNNSNVIAPTEEVFCLNNGYLNPRTNLCICQHDYHGKYCEIPVCYNYCIRGTCRISSTGYPQCECDAGYSGERCENDLCNGYCLNGGRCNIENGEPNCQCSNSFYGRHCESMNIEEMCKRFCSDEVIDIELDLKSICNK